MPGDSITAALLVARSRIAKDLADFGADISVLPLTSELAGELELYITLIDTLVAERRLRPVLPN